MQKYRFAKYLPETKEGKIFRNLKLQFKPMSLGAGNCFVLKIYPDEFIGSFACSMKTRSPLQKTRYLNPKYQETMVAERCKHPTPTPSTNTLQCE